MARLTIDKNPEAEEVKLLGDLPLGEVFKTVQSDQVFIKTDVARVLLLPQCEQKTTGEVSRIYDSASTSGHDVRVIVAKKASLRISF